MKLRDLGEFPFIEQIESMVKVDDNGGQGVEGTSDPSDSSNSIDQGRGYAKSLSDDGADGAARGLICGIGDDCAVYGVDEAYDEIVSVDTMVEGVHFSEKTTDPYSIGQRLGAANISDLAAMGGEGLYALVSVAAPPDCEVERLKGIYEGLQAMCQTYGLRVIGGDTVSTAGPLVLTVTVIGRVPKGQAVYRRGAQIGDRIGVTGHLGAAAVGLATLLAGVEGYEESKAKHQRPQPRIAWGQFLRQAGATAMDDTSDGLANELWEVAKASKCRLIVYDKHLPLIEEVRQWAEREGQNPADYAYNGGEDFELLFTMAEDQAQYLDVLRKRGDKTIPDYTWIGSVVPGEGPAVTAYGLDGQGRALAAKGYDHFKK